MTLYLSHDISYGCTVINDSFIENALPWNFIKTTIHVIQPRAPNSRNTSLLSMQFSNGYDSDTGENRWTSVLNISFENSHLSLYKSWSTHSSYFNTDELRVHMDWWRIVFILRRVRHYFCLRCVLVQWLWVSKQLFIGLKFDLLHNRIGSVPVVLLTLWMAKFFSFRVYSFLRRRS